MVNIKIYGSNTDQRKQPHWIFSFGEIASLALSTNSVCQVAATKALVINLSENYFYFQGNFLF